MMWDEKILVTLLLATLSQLHFLKAQLDFSFHDQCVKSQTYAWDEMDILYSDCSKFASDGVITLVRDLAIINEMFELTNENLVLIIAEHTKDAIQLAEFLSTGNKVLPQKSREDFKENEKPLYDFVLKNLQMYENPDISTTFFIYPRNSNNEKFTNQIVFEMIKAAENAKIILTLSNPGSNVDSESFNKKREFRVNGLFEVAGKVIRNVEKYENSSFFIVTNGTFNKNYLDFENDLNIDEEMEQYYFNLISKYSQQNNASKNGKLLAKYMISDKENVIFAGGMTNSRFTQVMKHLDNVKYTIASIHDYENQMYFYFDCLFEMAEKKLTSYMNSLNEILSSYLTLQERKSNMSTLSGVFTFTKKVNYVYKILSLFLECMAENDTTLFNSCVDKMNGHLQNLGIANDTLATCHIYFFILCQIKTTSIMEIPESAYVRQPEKWTFELQQYKTQLMVKKNWYNNLLTTYLKMETLSETEIMTSLQYLFQGITNNEYQNLDGMKNAYKTVKSNAIKMETNYSCLSTPNGLKLQVTGKLLKLSTILNKNKCKGYKILELFSLEKIIIDQDITAVGQELNVYIFSPTWEVLFKRNIILDGISRNLTTKTYLEPKAKNGNQVLNRNGAHGLAGLPGGPAGNFYGIANTIINGEDLKISLNGGSGSNGQDGGDAADGEDGEIPTELYLKTVVNPLDCTWIEGDNNYYTIEASKKNRNFIVSTKPFITRIHKNECYIFGMEGFPGGRGGNGGIKGKGSKAGDLKLFLLNDSVKIPVVLSTLNGTDGKYGVGGKKGLGGFIRKVTWRTETDISRKFFSSIVANVPFTRGTEGEDGKDNTSIIGSKVEKEATVSQSFVHTMNLYKRFILSNIKSKNSVYINLYKQIVNNKNIHKNYDTLALVEELVDLEEYYYNIENKSDTLFLYQSLGNRIKDYALNRKESETTDTYTDILRYLDTMVSHKVERLNRNSNSNLVFMLTAYLKKCKEQFEHLKTAKTVVEIKEINRNFSKEYDSNIEVAQRIIQENIQKDIDEMNFELEGETETLMRQIIRFIGQEKYHAEDTSKKLKLVEKKNIFKSISVVFDIINTALGFINPALSAIGSKISSAVSIVLNFKDDTSNKEIVDFIPNAIDKSYAFYESIAGVKIQAQKLAVEWNLNEITEEKENLENNGENTQPLESLESEIQNLQSSVTDNKLPIKDLLISIYEKLCEEIKKWEKLNEIKSNIYAGALKVMKKLKTFSQIKQIVGDFSMKIDKLKDQSEIQRLNHQINEIYQKTSKLRIFKDEIYANMIPIIEKIRETTNISGKVSSFNVVLLDFEKFQMKEYFKKVLSQLKMYIKEFGVQVSFEGTLKNLEDAINMMLSTYTRIQEYIETKKKAKYDMELSLVPFDITYVKDTELSMALANMIQISYANIVLDDYRKFKTSLKFYTFPFAHEFFGTDSTIPEVNDIFARANEAGRRYEIYGTKLFEISAERRRFDKTVAAKFGDNLPPFHIWDNRIYSTEINNILMGNEVTLFANISEHKSMNAIKFSEIWLLFKSTDSSISTDDINDDLKSFSVQLIHEGDSYYRCDDRMFLINSKTQIFEDVYNYKRFENTNNGENELLKKGNKNFNILSPYATWKIQLIDALDDKQNFAALEKYKSKVNIELIGYGQFTGRNLNECKSNLTEYYENEV